VKGTLLKQTAMLERERLEVAKLKLKLGSGDQSDVAAAQERFEKARKDYCTFMDKAEYVD
jgi:outer membrane protein TolC